MRFPHSIRAAPFEFALYAFATLTIIAMVGGLVMVSADIAAPFFELIVVLGILGLFPAFAAAGCAPLILVVRRLWRRKFCWREFALHLIISLALLFACVFLFDLVARA